MNVKDLKQIKDIILDSLKSFREDLKKDFATKDDLKQLATKDDLRLGLDDLLADIVEVVDKNKAEKSVVEELSKRVDEIEKTIQITQ